MTKISIDFDDSQYRRSHSTAPRGRGGWAFSFGSSEPWFTPSVLFAEAKKLARAEAERRGFSGTVEVLP